jgi:diacylglycerol O-acyltransferase / wax synthase
MPSEKRLSPLDASFLAIESPSAHMHVGWAATFLPPEGRQRPSFERLRAHIGVRLPRAPRYRQRLKEVPLGLSPPYWIDDEDFDLDRHVVPAGSDELDEIVEECMSEQLPKDRPLWQICVADRLRDGRIGIVGKAHHSMVDGIAAVELVSLLLDPEPDPRPPGADDWRPRPEPTGTELLVRASAGRTWERLRFARGALRALSSSRGLGSLAGLARPTVRALTDAARPAKGSASLNAPISPRRHLGTVERPLDDLKQIKGAFGTTINDVVLAVCAGAMRGHLHARGETVHPLKAMVPVDMRVERGGDDLGNQISFVFCDLPCDEPDPVKRLRRVQEQMASRKRADEPSGGGALLQLVGQAVYPLHRLASRLVASPRAFNLVISNIPGPPEQMYMCGCRLHQPYPVVPLADRHALSIGMTSVGGGAFFGLYADRDRLPDVDRLATELEAELDHLMELAERRQAREGEAGPVFAPSGSDASDLRAVPPRGETDAGDR